jgi:hypothetical protein
MIEWAKQYPEAAAALSRVLGGLPWAEPVDGADHSEAWSQQRVRFAVAQAGGMAWRNNVGATPSECPECGAHSTPVRYGLANDSARLNSKVKSSDLILAIPRRITQADVGTTLAQFGAVECKRPGWKYTGDKREVAQLAWLTLVRKLGGFATFSTGEVQL